MSLILGIGDGEAVVRIMEGEWPRVFHSELEDRNISPIGKSALSETSRNNLKNILRDSSPLVLVTDFQMRNTIALTLQIVDIALSIRLQTTLVILWPFVGYQELRYSEVASKQLRQKGLDFVAVFMKLPPDGKMPMSEYLHQRASEAAQVVRNIAAADGKIQSISASKERGLSVLINDFPNSAVKTWKVG